MSTATILADFEQFVPKQYRAMRPLMAGWAAAFDGADQAGEMLRGNCTISTAAGKWLDLLAVGFGLRRQPAESDDSLRYRIQHPADALTRPAILDVVNAYLTTIGQPATATMIEWFQGPALDVDFWLDQTVLQNRGAQFVLVVPQIGNTIAGSGYLDSEAFGIDLYLGSDGIDPAYNAIIALVNAIRAAGVRWALRIDQESIFT